MNIENRPNEMRNFHYGEFEGRNPDNPLNVVFLTSVRDTGAEDRNGSMIEIPEGRYYMMGIIEAVTRLINSGRHQIADLMRVRGIITDDHPRDRMNGYRVSAHESDGLWIHPDELRDDRGERLISNTSHIPSTFRRISGRRRPDEKRASKEAFENEVMDVSREMGADILVSDHLMLRLERTIDENRDNLFGRILNIHPAMTRGNYPLNLRGKTPTEDALNRSNGFRITEDGERIEVPRYFYTGATLHVIDNEIDAGAVLTEAENTYVSPNDEPQQMRFRNYLFSKIPVFIEGMRHYIRNVYPNLEQINFRNEPDHYEIANHNEPQNSNSLNY